MTLRLKLIPEYKKIINITLETRKIFKLDIDIKKSENTDVYNVQPWYIP